MALTRSDKDFQSFVEVDGKQARRVYNVNAGNLLEGIVFDYIGASYPTSTSEVFTYKIGGSGGTTQATITVVYTDATKEFISSVTRA